MPREGRGFVNKKEFLGAGAIFAGMISAWLGIWSMMTPSFDKIEVDFNNTNATFQEVVK